MHKKKGKILSRNSWSVPLNKTVPLYLRVCTCELEELGRSLAWRGEDEIKFVKAEVCGNTDD